MSGVRVRYQTLEFGSTDIHVRTLRNTQEFDDDEQFAEALGISPAMWPYFGVLWASGRALAHLASELEVDDRRILEVGCGIAAASLVLNKRDADITATDRHPEAGPFLAHNTQLNGDSPIPYQRTSWSDGDDTLGTFDLLIGADLLYDRDQVQPLADFLARHARPHCTIVIVGPRRGLDAALRKGLARHGFTPLDVALSEHTDVAFSGAAHGFQR